MWRTVKKTKKGKPLWDINEQGKLYSYRTQSLIGKLSRKEHPYYCVSDSGKTVYIHTLVAKAFPEICGEWFEGCEVHHKDCNPLNNCAENLIVCTKEEHLLFHKKYKEELENKRFRQYLKEKTKQARADNAYVIEKVREAKEKGNIKVHFYCRASKANRKGLSPIEVSVCKNQERNTFTTSFKSTVQDFKEKKYSCELKKFIETITKIAG